jgi:hypothetical protein
MTSKLALVLLLLLPGCAIRHKVQAFNANTYRSCVQKHGGETWQAGGLTWTCKGLTFPSCNANAQIGESQCR